MPDLSEHHPNFSKETLSGVSKAGTHLSSLASTLHPDWWLPSNQGTCPGVAHDISSAHWFFPPPCVGSYTTVT
jgi:hypothetical protein